MDYEAELIAERENKMPIGAFKENQQLREQLAAERKRTFEAQQAALREGIRSGQFQEQLDAAVEQMNAVRPYLHPGPVPGYVIKEFDAALAKIGGK